MGDSRSLNADGDLPKCVFSRNSEILLPKTGQSGFNEVRMTQEQNSCRCTFFISFSLVFLRKNGKTRAGGAPQWGQSGWPPKNTNIRRPLKQPNWVAPFVHWVCHTRMHSTHVREYLCESVADASTKRPFSALTVVFALMHALDTRQGVSLRIGTTRPRNDPSPHLQSF